MNNTESTAKPAVTLTASEALYERFVVFQAEARYDEARLVIEEYHALLALDSARALGLAIPSDPAKRGRLFRFWSSGHNDHGAAGIADMEIALERHWRDVPLGMLWGGPPSTIDGSAYRQVVCLFGGNSSLSAKELAYVVSATGGGVALAKELASAYCDYWRDSENPPQYDLLWKEVCRLASPR